MASARHGIRTSDSCRARHNSVWQRESESVPGRGRNVGREDVQPAQGRRSTGVHALRASAADWDSCGVALTIKKRSVW